MGDPFIAQAQSIAAWCQAHGYRLESVYIETMSAARAETVKCRSTVAGSADLWLK